MIGTITFHWATNYGAVLQAYALQSFLLKCGYNTEIVNYVPWTSIAVQSFQWLKQRKIDNYRKEKKLEKFRKKYLLRSKLFIREKQLKNINNRYTAIVCGSDQIWNESFTLYGEFRPTLAYFLNFAGNNTKRISYAASFGTTKTSEAYDRYVIKELSRFSSISVRELTGRDIVGKYGQKAEVVCDPTLLLKRQDYLELIENVKIKCSKVFDYVLHGHNETRKIADYVIHKYGERANSHDTDGLIEWLYRINAAEIVITNSFHGIMLSLILNRPFVAVLIKGSGMNDRITTILHEVGLDNRIIYEFNEKHINSICSVSIDWEKINQRLNILRNRGKEFLTTALC